MTAPLIPLAIKAAKAASLLAVARAKSYPKRKIQQIKTAPRRTAERIAHAPADAIANSTANVEALIDQRVRAATSKARGGIIRTLLILLILGFIFSVMIRNAAEDAAKDYAKDKLGPFGFFISANNTTCGPPDDGPIGVANIGYAIGDKARQGLDADPQQVKGAVHGFLEDAGAFLGAFTQGFGGAPAPESVDGYDAKVISARNVEVDPCGQPCTTNGSQEGPGLARAAAAAAGFTGEDLDIAVGVAGAESSYRPDATNTNRNGSVDHGLFQINSVHATILATGDWKDPYVNARMAKQVYDDAGGWTPWVTYKNGAYKNHMATPVVGTTDCSPGTGEGGFIQASLAGYENGRIPAEAMCIPQTAPGHHLQCDAAAAFDLMSAAYAQQFGTNISVTDSYRDHAGQVDCRKRKGSMCAVPGTSNHGWGAAADLGGGIQRFGTPQHAWMVQNAPQYGWILPAWAQANGSKPEPWHWEYTNAIKAG